MPESGSRVLRLLGNLPDDLPSPPALPPPDFYFLPDTAATPTQRWLQRVMDVSANRAALDDAR